MNIATRTRSASVNGQTSCQLNNQPTNYRFYAHECAACFAMSHLVQDSFFIMLHVHFAVLVVHILDDVRFEKNGKQLNVFE